MKTVLKLIVVVAVVINPVALSASGFQGFLIRGAHPAALAGPHYNHRSNHHPDTSHQGSVETGIHGCDGSKCMVQDSNGCALHYHHSPTLALDNDAGAPVMFQRHVSFEPRKRMSSRVIRPETPPPKYL